MIRSLILVLMMTWTGAMAQSSILILKLYDSDKFKTQNLDTALNQAGFTNNYLSEIPSAEQLDSALDSYDQFWVVSDWKRHLDSTHLEVIQSYLEEGKGLYLLADNEPYDADADYISQYFTGATFDGNYMADKRASSAPGGDLLNDESYIYEGFTVSSLSMSESVKPQIIGSDGQVCVASFDNAQYRILLDGGFTKMYNKWNRLSAKYFVEAANWLSK